MHDYINTILNKSDSYLREIFSKNQYEEFIAEVKLIPDEFEDDIVYAFSRMYERYIKVKHQSETKYNRNIVDFITKEKHNKKIKVVWGDCYDALRKMPSESVQLMVTSPPYYNAREYSQWPKLTHYLRDMKKIIKEAYRVLDNHRVFVWNIGDIFGNDNLKVKSVWGDRRLPLGSYSVKLFEDAGFTFVDDFIWDKGEVQSNRSPRMSTPHALYQYPINCYEHIYVFHKHRLDITRFPCPVCGCLNVNGNTQTEVGLQSWECKNDDCFERSKSNRGKRFSLKTNLTQRHQGEVPDHILKKWRKDVVKFSPVIKINNKGENTLGHSAPFPEDIPEMAVQLFSFENDVVLDPFAGSFTSCIVANRLKRNGVGIELRKDLFEKSIKNNIKETHKMDYVEYSMKTGLDKIEQPFAEKPCTTNQID